MTERPETSDTALPSRRRVVLITGMSGAGLSVALKAFEDLGYEAVDNLRLGLVPALVADSAPGGATAGRPLAIAVDTRNANFSVEDMLRLKGELAARPEVEAALMFLECSDEALQRRFTETRRRHPLAVDRPVMDGIRRERETLWKLRDEADHVIDTSLLAIHELRRVVIGNYRTDNAVGLTLFVTSFSFRHGVPREADMVFDARFLINPHWNPKLRGLTGLDPAVAACIQGDPGYAPFMEHVGALIVPLLPRYQQEGKSYLTVAVGCTGGRHRSVFVAEQLSALLAAHGYIVGVGHRDLDRAAGKG